MALKKNPKVDLKRKYQRYWEISLIISLTILIVAFKFFPKFEQEVLSIDAPQELIQTEDVEATKQETAPPPPPKPPIPIEAPTDDVLEDVEIESTELDVDATVSAPPPPPKVEEEEVEPVFFVAVEEMPLPIGGIGAIQSKIVYPEIAKRAGVQGRVYVKAYVDENGKVTKVELVHGIGAGCDEAAMEAVNSVMFSPGKQRGKPVKVQVTVPVLFKLQ
ncbi:MAG: energy transducer TonB [Bacteroidetes bacterium]|nr:energy transducer TonB [Bacteroidota bacterium]MBU1114552.1 energy transducer TonB [Bacteroidota bacterium]MBU1800469.1 energy transducer TonB [Bacteroidota bacterium]